MGLKAGELFGISGAKGSLRGLQGSLQKSMVLSLELGSWIGLNPHSSAITPSGGRP